MNNDNEGSSVITQPLFWEDGKENRKYGLHRATIDVVPTHSYPTDSYMSRFTKSLRRGWRVPPIVKLSSCIFNFSRELGFHSRKEILPSTKTQ